MLQMNGLDAFTFTTGVVGILGFIIQIADLFPKHREVRKSIFLIVLGIFIGQILNLVRGASSEYAVPLTPFHALVSALVLGIGVVTVVAISTSDREKRSELLAASGVGCLLLVLILLFGGITPRTIPGVRSASMIFSIDELAQLVDVNIERGNYDRAVQILTAAEASLSDDDVRQELIAIRRETIKDRIRLKAKPLAPEAR